MVLLYFDSTDCAFRIWLWKDYFRFEAETQKTI